MKSWYLYSEGGDKMSANMLQTRLTLHFYGGFDEYGKEIIRTKNFLNIDINATNAQLKNSAEALASLQQYSLEAVTRSNVYDVQNS